MQYIGIQGSYSGLSAAYFSETILKKIETLEGMKASSHLIPLLQKLFAEQNITLQGLDFIAADYGPGAFTSLRVTISTLNGIAYASKIPLVTVSGLDALALQAEDFAEKENLEIDGVIGLLNAYNNDVYFVMQGSGVEESGCAKIEEALALGAQCFAEKRILVVGNAVPLHLPAIESVLSGGGIQITQLATPLGTCSAEYVGKLGYQYWLAGKNIVSEIIPNYLKEQMFTVSK